MIMVNEDDDERKMMMMLRRKTDPKTSLSLNRHPEGSASG
jgi:hypothetical protein